MRPACGDMKTIGKYIIRGLLGRGGMSRVYKVEIPVIGKIAALKRLEPDPMLVHLMGIAEIRRRFIAEAVRMAGLRHPHILDIWDFNAEDDRPYYLMNYYTDNLGRMIGETYRTEAPSRVLPLDSAIQLYATDSGRVGLPSPCRHYPPRYQALQYSAHR